MPADFWIEAHHFDGFTERLLSWDMFLADDSAVMKATWFDPGKRGRRSRPSMEREIGLDIGPFRELVATFGDLKSDYGGCMDDVGSFDVRWPTDTGVQTCRTDLLRSLCREHPELERVFELWRQLDAVVERELATSSQ